MAFDDSHVRRTEKKRVAAAETNIQQRPTIENVLALREIFVAITPQGRRDGRGKFRGPREAQPAKEAPSAPSQIISGAISKQTAIARNRKGFLACHAATDGVI